MSVWAQLLPCNAFWATRRSAPSTPSPPSNAAPPQCQEVAGPTVCLARAAGESEQVAERFWAKSAVFPRTSVFCARREVYYMPLVS